MTHAAERVAGSEDPASFRMEAGPSGPADRLPSVCVVTSEIVGPPGSGGIGTAMTGLAEHLAASGCPVTILYTGGISAPDIRLDPWKARYAEHGIELAALSIEALKNLAGPVRDHGFGTPYLVYQFLSARHFDVVHFNDYGGEGSLCLAARKLGLAFRESLLVVALHGPSQWALELNRARPITLMQSALDHAERLSVKCADVLWSPSQYLLDWARQHGFDLPPQTIVQQYCLPSPPSFRMEAGSSAPTAPVTEIVFFGRLEARKGLPLFCDALDQLHGTLVDRHVSVTFLGKPGVCEGMDGLAYLARRSKAWRFVVKAVTDLGQAEAIAYLRSGGKLAVMASPADNSPCTVYEALSWGIPFLAAGVGGIPELVHLDGHSRVLFDGTSEALRGALLSAVDQGAWIGTPAVTQDEVRRQWLDFHANWRTTLAPVARPGPTGSVAAIVDGGSAEDLDRTLTSLSAITGINRVLVLTRQGIEMPRSELLPVCNIDPSTSDTKALNDELAMLDAGSVLLIHAGITVHASAFAQVLAALNMADIDGLQCAGEMTRWATRRIVPPLGGDQVFTRWEGATFTGGLLMRGAAVSHARRGQGLAGGEAFADLVERLVAEGPEIWPCPLPVFERTSHWKGGPARPLPSTFEAERPRRSRAVWALRLIDLGLAPLVRAAASWRRRMGSISSRRWINRLDG